jgi:hypothetical protein
MMNVKPQIDPNRMIEREANGCKVRLFFSVERNERVERQTLDHLILVFDRKKRELANVRL